jgi:hypothetical protein
MQVTESTGYKPGMKFSGKRQPPFPIYTNLTRTVPEINTHIEDKLKYALLCEIRPHFGLRINK